jgi:hypothetical protein
MVLFGCDWCKRPAWDDTQSCHPLAVHFCSVEHKDNYLAALFETEPEPVESIVKSKTTVMPKATIEREYRRTASSGVVTTTTKKKRTTKARRSA